MISSKLLMISFFEQSSFKLRCETVIGIVHVLKHVAFFIIFAKLLVTVAFTFTFLDVIVRGFWLEEKYWWIDGFSEKGTGRRICIPLFTPSSWQSFDFQFNQSVPYRKVWIWREVVLTLNRYKFVKHLRFMIVHNLLHCRDFILKVWLRWELSRNKEKTSGSLAVILPSVWSYILLKSFSVTWVSL